MSVAYWFEWLEYAGFVKTNSHVDDMQLDLWLAVQDCSLHVGFIHISGAISDRHPDLWATSSDALPKETGIGGASGP